MDAGGGSCTLQACFLYATLSPPTLCPHTPGSLQSRSRRCSRCGRAQTGGPRPRCAPARGGGSH